MTRFLTLLVLAGGAALFLAGSWWLWTSLDFIQIERGWAGVIAGTVMLSAGAIVAAIGAVLVRLGRFDQFDSRDRMDDGIGRDAPVPAAVSAPTQVPASSSTPITHSSPPDLRTDPVVAREPAPEEVSTPGERVKVGQHVSGDTTYIMFADGTVEARSPEGTVTFDSLDSLRAHADEREAAAAREQHDR